MKAIYKDLLLAAAGAALTVPALAFVGAPGLAPATEADAKVKAGVDAWQAGDYAKAVDLWRPLASAGNADAQFNLAQAYRLGRGVPADAKAGEDWYRKAAMQDHVQAQSNYGLIRFQNGDRAGAMPWLQKAAEKGDPRAQYVVGTALFNGEPLPRDWVRAYALMTRAAATGLPPAVTSLSEMDKYIPLDQRKQGMAMAEKLARTASLGNAPPPRGYTAPPPPRPPAPPVAKPVAAPPAAKPAPPVAVAQNAAPKPPPTAKPVPPAPAAKPASAPPAQGGWRVQLGAFGAEAKARTLWESLKGRSGQMASLQPYLVKAGAFTRLQAGPLPSKAAAEKACASVKSASQPCFVTAAP